MSKKRKPILAAAVFCDSASRNASGKVNCRGVFTAFLAWAYPTSVRTWNAILTLYNLPKGETKIKTSISYGSGKKVSLPNVVIEPGNLDFGNVIIIPMLHQFKKEGLYSVHFNVVNFASTLEVPLKIITQPWPQFSRRQLEFLKKNPSLPHSIRTTIQCSKCSSPYVLEESVLPDIRLADNVTSFPKSGVFVCESCSKKINLRDIQGQVRSSIQTAVCAAMQGEK